MNLDLLYDKADKAEHKDGSALTLFTKQSRLSILYDSLKKEFYWGSAEPATVTTAIEAALSSGWCAEELTALNEALTEGKLNYTTAEDFLINNHNLSRMDARAIVEAWIKQAGGAL